MAEDDETEQAGDVTIRRSKDGREMLIEVDGDDRATILVRSDRIEINGVRIVWGHVTGDGGFEISGRVGRRRLSVVLENPADEGLPN